jgi:hypothetical protein
MIGDGCFPAGTPVAVETGEQPIEALHPGQLVRTATGPQPLAALEPREAAAGAAILLHAGALGPGQPSRDLLVSPEQLLLVRDHVLPEGVLVPAGALVNGRGVQRTTRPAGLAWFALAFDAHTLPLVAGLAAGCLRDTATPLSARLLPPGPGLFALRGRLGRAAPPPAAEPPPPPAPAPPSPPAPLPADTPALQLVADGRPVPAERDDGGHWRFTIPPDAASLRLASPIGHPPDGKADGRNFGVAILALLLDGIPLSLTGPACGDGFHPPEGNGTRAWRWTDGDAELALPPCATPRRLEVTISDWHLMLRRGR